MYVLDIATTLESLITQNYSRYTKKLSALRGKEQIAVSWSAGSCGKEEKLQSAYANKFFRRLTKRWSGFALRHAAKSTTTFLHSVIEHGQRLRKFFRRSLYWILFAKNAPSSETRWSSYFLPRSIKSWKPLEKSITGSEQRQDSHP